MRTFVFVIVMLMASPLSAQIHTEVWTGSLDTADGRFVVSDLTNVSKQHPGYDNQPAFFPDGETLVFTSEQTSLEDNGLGLHAFLYDLRQGTVTPLPEARGFSPTPTADGKQLMMLREGRVWLHDLTGRLVRPLTETSEAGYYSRFDDRTYALFMNDKDRRIVIYDAAAKSLDTMATGAITAPYRIPGQRAVTFVALEEGKKLLRRLDLDARKVETVATIPFATGGQHVWRSKGTLLMASGATIYEWSPARPAEWTAVWRSDHPELQGISRIALGPAEKRIALVSTPRDETIIRDARAASNAAIAAHRADVAAGFFLPDGTVTASSGAHRDGREAVQKALADQFAERPDIIYIRTPDRVEISATDNAAAEHGTWVGRWTDPTGQVERRGTYMAVWRRTITDAGTPAWSIQTELFAAR